MNFEVLMDPKENPHKCTVTPLKGRTDILIRKFSDAPAIKPFSTDLLLHVDGLDLPTLVAANKINSIGVIDCVWKRVEPILKRLENPLPTLARIPEGFVTAYPRRNKLGHDPDAGLATIEAMFIAGAFAGAWDETLLDNYYFKDNFIKFNEALWKKFKLGPNAV
jgi:pre-rRNA-processing protein TSR3